MKSDCCVAIERKKALRCMEHATTVRTHTWSCHCRRVLLNVAITLRSPSTDSKRPPSFRRLTEWVLFFAQNCRKVVKLLVLCTSYTCTSIT